MVRIIVLSVVLHTLNPAVTWGSESTAIVWHRDLIQAARVAGAQQRLLLLVLSTPDCVYCQRMVKKTLLEPWINAQVNRRYVAVQLNGKTHPQLVDQLRVRVFPTTAIVHPSGKVIAIMHGFKAPPVFAQQLAKIQSTLDRQIASAIVARQQH